VTLQANLVLYDYYKNMVGQSAEEIETLRPLANSNHPDHIAINRYNRQGLPTKLVTIGQVRRESERAERDMQEFTKRRDDYFRLIEQASAPADSE
jgi:hypothetical protein